MKTVITSLLLAAAFGLSASANTLLFTDFSNDLINHPPVGPVVLNNVYVVDSTTTPHKDPFGPDGNKSMAIVKQNTGSAFPTATWTYDNATEATVKFSVYAFEGETTWTTPMLTVFLGKDGIGGSIPITLIFSRTHTQLRHGSSLITISNSWSTNAVQEVEIHYTADARYSLSINGTRLQTTAGVDTFDFMSNPGSLNTLRLSTSASDVSNSLVFINEVEVQAVPEPSTAALLWSTPLLLGGLLWRKRREGRFAV